MECFPTGEQRTFPESPFPPVCTTGRNIDSRTVLRVHHINAERQCLKNSVVPVIRTVCCLVPLSLNGFVSTVWNGTMSFTRYCVGAFTPARAVFFIFPHSLKCWEDACMVELSVCLQRCRVGGYCAELTYKAYNTSWFSGWVEGGRVTWADVWSC